MYDLLQTINNPADLRALDRKQLQQVAVELREFLIDSVSQTGGHLSSNLGTVELTIALHYVFDTPHDRLVWDVGHQTYGHTSADRPRARMQKLRMWQGMSGFPRRERKRIRHIRHCALEYFDQRRARHGGREQARRHCAPLRRRSSVTAR